MKTCLTLRSGTSLHRQTAVEEGLSRLGWKILPVEYTPGRPVPAIPDGQFLITSGLAARKEPVRLACAARGIPALVVELGYMKRADGNSQTGYFQLGWNRIGWTPGEAPGDRFDLLGLEVADKQERGDRILVAAQVGNDAQHRLSSADLTTWLDKRASEAARELRLPAYWRPHPKQDWSPPSGWPPARVQRPKEVPLERAFDRVEMVVTYNSTLGVDAMLRGIPVSSHVSAHYYGWATADRQTRLNYLHRLAYAQWTLDEMRAGAALEFVLESRPNTEP